LNLATVKAHVQTEVLYFLKNDSLCLSFLDVIEFYNV